MPKIGCRNAADRVVEPVEPREPRDRGRLAAGDHEAVEAVELLREPHLDRVRAEPPKRPNVLAERALEGEHADPRCASVHDADSRCGPAGSLVRGNDMSVAVRILRGDAAAP